jgi:DNA-binding transcriptional LysR family regulator
MSAADLDPDLLKAFLAVAEQRSFTRAADMLNRTQSAVSVQIRRLEQQLGTKLLHRSSAGAAPTAAGEELRSYARRILALNAEAFGALRARKVETVVRLGVMDVTARSSFRRCWRALPKPVPRSKSRSRPD